MSYRHKHPIAKSQDGLEASHTRNENEVIETESQKNLRTRDKELSKAWEVVESKRRTLGLDHAETISAMVHLASTLREMGKLHEAVLMQRQVLQKRQEILGESATATLAAMGNLGMMLSESGLLQEALSAQREVLIKQQIFLGEDDLDTVKTMNNLANTLRDVGQHQEALLVQREVLGKLQRILGDNDLETVDAMHNLAATLVHLGQDLEALKLQRKVVSRRRELLPADDLTIIAAMENLAITLRRLDQLDQAVSVKEKVLESRRRVLGDDHPDTIRAMQNLGPTMGQLGWHDESLALQKQALEKCRKVLGEAHPRTISAISDMTVLLKNLDRLDETMALEKDVLEKRTQILGEHHPDTLTSMHGLTITLYKVDRLDEAVTVGKRTLEMRRKIIGDHHIDTVSTIGVLVTILDKLERHDESLILNEELLGSRKQILGENHEDTISAMTNLAVTFQRLDRLKEAASMRIKVLEKRNEVVGADHPDTIWAMVGLVQTLDMMELYEQSAMIEEEVLEKWKRMLGDEHIDTIMAMSCLARSLGRLGRVNEALVLKQDVLEKRRGVLGSDHHDTILAMVDLVMTHDALKQYEQSAILETEVLERRTKTLGKSHTDTISARRNLTLTLKMLGRLEEAKRINDDGAVQNDNASKSIPLRTMNIRGSGQTTFKRLSSPGNIRLVIVHAGTGDAAPSGNIVEMDLREAEGKYIALSYTWGDVNLTRSIDCDGLSINITENLYSALQRLRQPVTHLRFWCDALCIDQGDSPESLRERSSQVQMMDRIFGGALRVVVDLGADDGTLAQAVEGVNAILRTSPALRSQYTTQSDPLAFLGLPNFDDPMWPALNKLMLRPWFRRIWCVQEVVLARDIRIVFGDHALTFEQLFGVVVMASQIRVLGLIRQQSQIWNVNGFFQAGTIAAACLLEIYNKRKARAEKESMSLCDLVRSTMRHRSTDRRDRVYALYGMVDSDVVAELPVDYSESHAQLSYRVSRYLIDDGNQIWALSHSGGDRPGRPSWTLDLGNLDARYAADPMLSSLQPGGQSLSYSAGGSMEPQIRALDGDTCLGIRGVVLDEIVSRTGACPMPWDQMLGVVEGSPSSFTPKTLMGFVTWIASVVHWARRYTMADKEAVWRTLIVDFNLHADNPDRKANGRALPGYRTCYERLIEWIETLKREDLIIDPKNSRNQELEDLLPPSEGVRYLFSLLSAMPHRCVARTNAGTLALVPDTCHIGDEIAVFQGFPLPFVLRKDESNSEYSVVGICYVHGAMDGEMIQQGPEMQELLLR